MATVKRRIPQLSPWMTFELETDLLDPPIFKVRLRPLDGWDQWQAASTPGQEFGKAYHLLAMAIMAVVEWDLKDQEGKPIEVTEENKRGVLREILGEPVKVPEPEPGQEKEKAVMLGWAIVRAAQEKETFLKN